MPQRSAVTWILVGMLAVLGGFWLTTRAIAAIGALGARIARRWVTRPEVEAVEPLPSARLR